MAPETPEGEDAPVVGPRGGVRGGFDRLRSTRSLANRRGSRAKVADSASTASAEESMNPNASSPSTATTEARARPVAARDAPDLAGRSISAGKTPILLGKVGKSLLAAALGTTLNLAFAQFGGRDLIASLYLRLLPATGDPDVHPAWQFLLQAPKEWAVPLLVTVLTFGLVVVWAVPLGGERDGKPETP